MVTEFSLGNFRSFKEIQTLHLQAAKIKSKYPTVDKNNVFTINDKHKLLKSKIVYGANASGKSNLVKGLVAMLVIIDESFKNEDIIKKMVEPFRLSKQTIDEPTFFQICFILNNIPYRYGMQLKDGKITDEWLFGTPDKREVYFFIREGMSVKVNENQFKDALKILPDNEDDRAIYGESSLFLTVAAASKRVLAEKIVDFLSEDISVLSGLGDKKIMDIALNSLDSDEFKEKLVKLMNSIGIKMDSINNVVIDVDELPKEAKANFDTVNDKLAFIEISKKIHHINGNNKNPQYAKFDLNSHEAEGTKKIISLAPFIFTALKKGKVLIIDEFDARLHPRLSRKVIELFNSNETNPNNAQLIIVSHDTNLMDAQLFRRDQISFVDQDEFGVSYLYSLVEYKGIRNNSSFEKDYLKGKYGAVPFLNEVDNLFLTETP